MIRTPLIERVIELKVGEQAVLEAAAPIERGSFAFCLELMSQTASLISPHHRLVRLREGTFHRGVDSRVTIRATRIGAELQVSLETTLPVARAFIEMADAPRDAPTMSVAEEWVIDRRGRAHNGGSLYASVELSSTPPLPRIVQWAAHRGLGQLVGGLGPRGQQFGIAAPANPFSSSPGVIEGLTHLTEWQWYALAGESGRVEGVDSIEWYRIPRADEALVATVSCRGSRGGSPSFDAFAFGADHKPALELRGLRLKPTRLANDRMVPRVEWQSFVRLLDGQETNSAQ